MILINYLKLALIVIILSLPWSTISSLGLKNIPPISQEGNSFYEINPCDVSLAEFVLVDPKAIYQDHYFFRPAENTSISCFGKVAGVTVLQSGIETEFYISIGANPIISMLLQGIIWILLFSRIPKNKIKQSDTKVEPYTNNILIIGTAYLFTYSIYAEKRFYENSIYSFNFYDLDSYILIFLVFLFLTKNFIDLFLDRTENILNYVPFIFLISGLFTGSNLVFYSLLLVFLGLNCIFTKKQLSKFDKYYVFLSFCWLFNSHGTFFFKVGKLRGFASSSYEFLTNLYWIIFFFLILKGVYKLYEISKSYFNFNLLVKNLSYTTVGMLIFGFLGSTTPLLSYLSFFYFGLQRYVITEINPFLIDEFGLKVSWRGLFPSAETVGEFFGLSLLLFLFFIIRSNMKIEPIYFFGIISSGLGLYFSDNRTSIVLVFLMVVVYIFKDSLTANKKIIFILIFSFTSIFLILLIIGSSNYTSSFEFMSNSLYLKSLDYQFGNNYSSFLILLEESKNSSNIVYSIFSIFSTLAFLINRSEMWSVFFARYNPTLFELLFGSGPLNFGQLYGELQIKETSEVLLPHSSLLSFMVFFGVINLFFLITLFIYIFFQEKNNLPFILLFIYIFINIVKNDSLNYFAPFVFYYLLFLIFRKQNSEKLFNFLE